MAVLLDFEFIRIIFISSWPLFRVSDQKTKWKQNTLWFYYEYSFFLSFFPHRGKSEYFPIPFYDLVSLCATCRTTITKEKKKLREEKYWTSSGTNSFSFSFSRLSKAIFCFNDVVCLSIRSNTNYLFESN